MAKAQAQEPSMEEILASIRRIIADEDTGASAASKLASVAAKTQPSPTVSEDELDKLFDTNDDDVLELADADKEPNDDMDLSFEPVPAVKPQPAPPPVAPVAKAPPPAAPPVAVEAPVAEVRPAPQPQPEPARVHVAQTETMTDPLLSQSTDSMVSAAFDNLALTILNKNARTVEDLIQDMLRPMLRSWLDQNLPSLVERLVRAEIERVARGR